MHTHQLSIQSLEVSDSYVINDKLIARIANFSAESTDDSTTMDFEMLVGVFQAAFMSAGTVVPYDFNHMLFCMRNYNHMYYLFIYLFSVLAFD